MSTDIKIHIKNNHILIKTKLESFKKHFNSFFANTQIIKLSLNFEIIF